MDLRPDHFHVYKHSTSKEGCIYLVKLIGTECAIDTALSLHSIPDQKKAASLINTNTMLLRYHAPERVKLLLSKELSDK